MSNEAAPEAEAPDTDSPDTDTPDTESTESGEQSTSTPADTKQDAPKRWKLKVDDKEEEVDEPTLLKWAQRSKAADKRFQEGAKLRKESEALINFVKQNPAQAMAQLGLDPRKFAEEFLYEALQQEGLSPEERQRKEEQEELKRYREQEQERQKKEQAAKAEALKDAEADRTVKEMIPLMEKHGLPKTDHSIARVAQLWLRSQAAGHAPDLDWCVEQAKAWYLNDIQQLFGSADGDTLLKLIPDGVGKKYQEANLKRTKNPRAQNPGQPATPPKPKPLTREEYLAKLER